MSVPLKPLADRVVAQIEEAQNKTTSGFYLPDTAKEKSKIAKVVAVGELVRSVKQGDKIVYKEYSTTEIKVDGSDYIIVKEEDILATLAQLKRSLLTKKKGDEQKVEHDYRCKYPKIYNQKSIICLKKTYGKKSIL